MNNDISPIVREKAPLILAEIKKATNILLHCHPSPDPDSVGSALAMKFALEQMGKKATVIKGDSDIPQAFMHFPGATEIMMKGFGDINLHEYDLFISLDSGSIDRISRQPIVFPDTMKVINIDHHNTNSNFGSINLVEVTYPATCAILSDLFIAWSIKMDSNIASNIFIGIYTDTGAFKYRGVTKRIFEMAASLSSFIPDIPELVTRMENSNTPAFMRFEGAALDAIETSSSGRYAISSITYKTLVEKKIPINEIRGSELSSFMLSVIDWDIVASAVEFEPGKVKLSFRSRDFSKFDISKLAVMLGGGGHKMAAGAIVSGSIAEVKKIVAEKVKELYNL